MKLINNSARLVWGPSFDKGFLGPKWLPGENPVTDGYWAQAKEHPHIKRLLESGKLTAAKGTAKPLAVAVANPNAPKGRKVLVGPATPAGPEVSSLAAYQGNRPPAEPPSAAPMAVPDTPPETLASVTPALALVLIARTTDLDTLARWHESETREPVRNALEARGTALAGD